MRGVLIFSAVWWAACGGDEMQSFDLGSSLDLVGSHDHAMPPEDLAGADLAADLAMATPPDLLCACMTPPAAACSGNAIVSYASPGACVADADAGTVGLVCDYTQMTTPCTNGCFNATCSGALSFFGNLSAYENKNGTGVQIANDNATITAGDTVSITIQTYPPGSASDVHLVYTKSTDPGFTMAIDSELAYDKFTMNNDQWYTIMPGQFAGTTIVWYLYAHGYGLSTTSYYSNLGANYHTTSN